MGEGHGGNRKPQYRPLLHLRGEAEAPPDDKAEGPSRLLLPGQEVRQALGGELLPLNAEGRKGCFSHPLQEIGRAHV